MNPSLARRIQSIIPKMSSAKRKGDNGRIGVIGGSF
jgi:NAD(P)H-hydrate repair Nnr-like enzyme with NAD(P)H-hydrate dehydratase domain